MYVVELSLCCFLTVSTFQRFRHSGLRAVKPPYLQILRIDEEGIIDDVICAKKHAAILICS